MPQEACTKAATCLAPLRPLDSFNRPPPFPPLSSPPSSPFPIHDPTCPLPPCRQFMVGHALLVSPVLTQVALWAGGRGGRWVVPCSSSVFPRSGVQLSATRAAPKHLRAAPPPPTPPTHPPHPPMTHAPP